MPWLLGEETSMSVLHLGVTKHQPAFFRSLIAFEVRKGEPDTELLSCIFLELIWNNIVQSWEDSLLTSLESDQHRSKSSCKPIEYQYPKRSKNPRYWVYIPKAIKRPDFTTKTCFVATVIVLLHPKDWAWFMGRFPFSHGGTPVIIRRHPVGKWTMTSPGLTQVNPGYPAW